MGKPLNEVELRSMLCSYVAHLQFFTVKICSFLSFKWFDK